MPHGNRISAVWPYVCFHILQQLPGDPDTNPDLSAEVVKCQHLIDAVGNITTFSQDLQKTSLLKIHHLCSESHITSLSTGLQCGNYQSRVFSGQELYLCEQRSLLECEVIPFKSFLNTVIPLLLSIAGNVIGFKHIHFGHVWPNPEQNIPCSKKGLENRIKKH